MPLSLLAALDRLAAIRKLRSASDILAAENYRRNTRVIYPDVPWWIH